MKILHIAPEQGAALVAATTIHGIAQDCALTRAQTPASALEWLLSNRDTAAVIVEMQAQSCASFVQELRALGLTTPLVVVAGSKRLESALAVLNSGADGYVVAGPTLEADLPGIVAAAIERERSRREHLSQTLNDLRDAAAVLLKDIQGRYSVTLSRETRICLRLQERLFELEAREAEYAARLAEGAESSSKLAAELSVATAALDEARQARKADAVAAARHLRRRESELRADLAEAVAGRTSLEKALAEAEAAHQDTRQRAANARAAANDRQSALEDLLTHETDKRTSLDRELAAAETARQEADRRHAAELAELQGRYEAVVEESAAVHAAFARQQQEVASAFEQANQERTAEAAAAAARIARTEAELGGRLVEATAARRALERTLTETQAAQRHAMDRAAADLASAAAREAALDDRLAREMERGRSLEEQLAAAETARLNSESRYASELTAARADLASFQTRHDTTVAEYVVAVAVLEQSLTEAAAAHRQAEDRAAAALAAASRREAELADRLTKEFDARAEVNRDLTSARMEAARGRDRSLRVVSGYRRWVAEQRAQFEAQLTAEHDSRLRAQAERHRVAEQDSQVSLAKLEETLRQAVDASGSEIARLHHQVDALRRERDAARTQADALRGEAERVPDLQTQLERTRNEKRRQFERAPYALCCCSPSGAITDANHAFVTLLGCRRVEELRNTDFVSAAVDSAGDLGWLLERARTMRKTETVETRWKTRDGRRLVVRLQALATATGSIDIVAEDITGVRALEDRLRQAQRMEAVGRLASEVAVTCDSLLSDVVRGAHEWLARGGSDDDVRRHAERLVIDVTRAASFLRQLGMYGEEQVRALRPVSTQRILRDLAPVMKRLLGDRIELVLPKSGGSFDVDVDAERLERVLIIVAGYARERMPSGGQVRIDLATTAVGRRFVARYSNVRPGDHVLITVTELPAAELRGDTRRGSQSVDHPGVDLGVLLDLIASCGGHLWLEAQPAGNMVVKVHLPKPPAATASGHRSGRLSRWFRAASAANVGA